MKLHRVHGSLVAEGHEFLCTFGQEDLDLRVFSSSRKAGFIGAPGGIGNPDLVSD